MGQSRGKGRKPPAHAPKKSRVGPEREKMSEGEKLERLAASPASVVTSAPRGPTVHSEIQQQILNVFTVAFPVVAQTEAFQRTIQDVKSHLYNRDFEEAFSKSEYLDVYAARWSAARALAYADIFMNPSRFAWLFRLPKHSTAVCEPANTTEIVDQEPPSTLGDNAKANNEPLMYLKKDRTQSIENHPAASDPSDMSSLMSLQSSPAKQANEIFPTYERSCLKVVSLGGGAGAEIVALAATSRYLNATDFDDSDGKERSRPRNRLKILAVDVADWSDPVRKISSALVTPPELSQYASQSLRDSNRALIKPELDGDIDVEFYQKDVLSISAQSLKEMLKDVPLVTLMFTLNELFTSSLSKTTEMLLNLTQAAEVGTRLVVVDSPGSYSEIQVGKSLDNQSTSKQPKKRYPMKWLLDHTLLEVAGTGKDVRWAKEEDEESKWFRINDKLGLRYSVDLENCRYQIHVFKKVK